MGATAGVNERLERLTAAGVSVWLDEVRRSMIDSGELERLRVESSLRGVTSNPAIFEKAILGADEYDEEIARLASEGYDTVGIYLELAVHTVRDACDVLRPVWDETGGSDGFVSLEVEPALAHDGPGTLEQARDLWKRVDRPNVMIKIPGTEECVQAIEDATADGINVNITLLFKVESYEAIAGPTSAAWSAATPPASRSTSTPSRASSCRGSTQRSTSGSPSWVVRTCAGLRRSPTPRRRTRASGGSSTASASARCARPARRSSGRCGRRRASRTPPTPRRSTSTGWSRRRRSTPCR